MSVFIYGAGYRGWKYYLVAFRHYDGFVFVDRSLEKQKNGFWGNKVISPEDFMLLLNQSEDPIRLVIALADEKVISEVKDYYSKYENKIVYLNDETEKRRMIEEDRCALIHKDFSIISNNCWGGVVYDYFGLQYQSPTVGLFFLSDDYLRFVANLEKYLNMNMDFIPAKEANRYDECKGYISALGNYPIGRLGDLNLHFLHYKSEEEAYNKWNRRKARINWNKLIVKNSTQNLWTEEEMRKFSRMPYNNLVLFSNKRIAGISKQVYFSDGDDSIQETDKYPLYFDTLDYLNSIICEGY